MTNTESFPATVEYVPGRQLEGMLRLTPSEANQVTAVFWAAVDLDGESVQFDTHALAESTVGSEHFVDLVFSVAPNSVDAVAADLLVTLAEIERV